MVVLESFVFASYPLAALVCHKQFGFEIPISLSKLSILNWMIVIGLIGRFFGFAFSNVAFFKILKSDTTAVSAVIELHKRRFVGYRAL